MRQIFSIGTRVAAIGILLACAVTISTFLVILIMPSSDRAVRAEVPDQTYYEADANFERYCSRTAHFSSSHNRESPYICDLHQRLQAIETER